MKKANLKLNLNVKKTRKQVFLDQMEQVVPWAALVELIAPYYPAGKTGLKTAKVAPSTRRSTTPLIARSDAILVVNCTTQCKNP